MPEDLKKNQHKKGRNDPKEQRKPRQARQNNPPAEKKVEKLNEAPIVPVADKPSIVGPGPEFYKNLKRETDEILKITEEVNSKYNKKEIQSNWKKYEIPIETYDEIDEQENMGADYEKLIQIPMSAGGHFQFKHEKSWDSAITSSEYDKYFNVDMDNLTVALCTIPFYERNNIDACIFSEMDIRSMDNRATKYKQKYYNDKSFITPEMEASDKILHTLKESVTATSENETASDNLDIDISNNLEERMTSSVKDSQPNKLIITDEVIPDVQQNTALKNQQPAQIMLDDFDDILDTMKSSINIQPLVAKDTDKMTNKVSNKIISENEEKIKKLEVKEYDKVTAAPVDDVKKPVIESPEDLEKWLDDFLDG